MHCACHRSDSTGAFLLALLAASWPAIPRMAAAHHPRVLSSRTMFFDPFLAFYAILFFALLAGIFVMLEIHVINYAFGALGLPPELAFLALFASLIGSYINIPIA